MPAVRRRPAPATTATPTSATNDLGVLAAYVAAGLGAALVPELALAAFGPGVVVRPIADVPVRRRIYVSARRGGLARPALAAMVDELREAAAAR